MSKKIPSLTISYPHLPAAGCTKLVSMQWDSDKKAWLRTISWKHIWRQEPGRCNESHLTTSFLCTYDVNGHMHRKE